jgi:hypothetical protein
MSGPQVSGCTLDTNDMTAYLPTYLPCESIELILDWAIDESFERSLCIMCARNMIALVRIITFVQRCGMRCRGFIGGNAHEKDIQK